MLGVNGAVIRVDEVVVQEHLVPRGDKVDVDIICDLQVTIHSKESGESTVDRVVEGNSVKTVTGGVTQEVLVLSRCQVGGTEEVGRALGWGTSTPAA